MYEGKLEEIKSRFIDHVGGLRESYRESHLMKHIDWYLAINVGVLLWLIGRIDTFTISGKLPFKWLFISVVVVLLVSLGLVFRIRICLMKFENAVTVWLLEWERAASNEQMQNMDELDKWTKSVPSLKVGKVADVCLLSAFVLLVAYVLLFIMVHR